VLVCWSVFFIERTLKLDDPVGAISVHGVCGLWGILSLGLLADGTYGDGFNGVKGAVTGLFYGDPGQFAAQSIGGLANLLGVGLMTFVAWQITSLLTSGHRVSAETEELGLDIPEMGAHAYPDTSDLAAAVVLRGPGAKSAAGIAA
jgi:Amt family ammonium transporter